MDRNDDIVQKDMDSESSESSPEKENMKPTTTGTTPYVYKIPYYPKRPSTPMPYLGRDKQGHHICSPSFATRPLEEQRRVSQMSEELRNNDSRRSSEGCRSSSESSPVVSSTTSTIIPLSRMRTPFGSPILGRRPFELGILGCRSRPFIGEKVMSEQEILERYGPDTPILGRRSMESSIEDSSADESELVVRNPGEVPILGRGSMESVNEERNSAELADPSSNESVFEELNAIGSPLMGRISTEAMAERRNSVGSAILGRTKPETPILGRSVTESICSNESFSSIDSSFECRSSTDSSIIGADEHPMINRISSPSRIGARRMLKARRTLKTPYTRDPADVEYRVAIRPRGIPILGRQEHLSPVISTALEEEEVDDPDDPADPDYVPGSN